jgi:hypothetical protein
VSPSIKEIAKAVAILSRAYSRLQYVPIDTPGITEIRSAIVDGMLEGCLKMKAELQADSSPEP